MTPYYTDDLVTLYHGDCREITAWLAADVLVTDPPYGIAWSRASFNARHAIIGEGIVGDGTTEARDAALAAWGTVRPGLVFGSLRAEYPANWKRMLVFEKPVFGTGLIGIRVPWLSNWEPIFVLGDWPESTPRHSAVIKTRHAAASGYSGYVTKAGHPHAKPLDVMAALISQIPPGIVADPFAGVGSTLVAAKSLGRTSVGVELDERYCELAAKRLAQGVLDFGVA